MIANEPQFHVVWNPKHGLPNVQHVSLDVALAEAKRLAAINPGQRFYVLQAVKIVERAEPVQVFDFDDSDNYPF